MLGLSFVGRGGMIQRLWGLHRIQMLLALPLLVLRRNKRASLESDNCTHARSSSSSNSSSWSFNRSCSSCDRMPSNKRILYEISVISD